MNKKVVYNGKTYIETGNVFLYKIRMANMTEYELLTANEIKIKNMDLKLLRHYTKLLKNGKYFTPYKFNKIRNK